MCKTLSYFGRACYSCRFSLSELLVAQNKNSFSNVDPMHGGDLGKSGQTRPVVATSGDSS